MAGIHKLTTKQIENARGPCKLQDGGGLFVKVTQSGTRSFVFTYRFEGKRPEIGLGPFPLVSLKSARAKAAQGRAWLAEKPKIDPREAWQRSNASSETQDGTVTFGSFVEAELPRITATFSNPKHVKQWASSLKKYCTPIWDLPISAIQEADVAACISPQWATKRETMSRVRGRLEKLFDAASAKQLRNGDNPARWRLQQHFVKELSREEKRVKHHAAHHYEDMPRFYAELAGRNAISAKALQFGILTAARSQEIRGAKWSEVDLDSALWVVPATRMKAGLEHIVPLADQALRLLTNLPQINPYIFYNDQNFCRLSENAMLAVIKRMGDVAINREERRVTPHGCCRSSFKDWAGDRTDFDDQVSEFALAHVGAPLFKAYRHKTAVEKRRVLMQSWADFVVGN